MKTLKLAKDLSFPLDAVTQTFLVVGKRGSGKSNTAARFVEQLHHAHLPFVVLDPVDTWWGLKAGLDGGRGLDVYVFGGRKADLPLEAGGGALIAEVLCEHRLSMVLSVKHLSGRERSAFMVAFAQTLFQKWSGGPLHVVLEEAHEFAPQMAGSRSQNTDNESAMLGAFKRLWKLGRASGIGGTAVTQRPASLSKDITTQSEILIAHRTIGPQDVKAIGEWVKYHGERLDILAELPTLPTGEAFVWAPEFPEGTPIGLQRTAILLRETYDSASTPKVGEQRVEPKELAAVDLERLRVKMAATIEKAKADDPKLLRKRIAELERERRQAAPVADHEALDQAQQRGYQRGKIDGYSAAIDSLCPVIDRLSTLRQALDEHLGDFLKDLTKWKASRPAQNIPENIPAVKHPVHVHASRFDARLLREEEDRHTKSANGSLPVGERSILIACAQHAPQGCTREQLTILSGYKRSTRNAYIQRLIEKDYVEARGEQVLASKAGVAVLGPDFQPLPTGEALRDYWIGRLPEGERKILQVTIAAYPDEVSREAIGGETGYKRSTRNAYIQRLTTRQLIEVNGDGIRAREELFS